MPDAATIAVMRDLLLIAGLALAIAAVVYSFIRARSDVSWGLDGNVLARPYGPVEAALGLCLLGLIYFLFTSVPPAVEVPETKAPPSAEGIVSGMITTLLIALFPLVALQFRGLNPAEMFGLRQLPVRKAVSVGVSGCIVMYFIVVLITHLVLPMFLDPDSDAAKPQAPVEAFQNAHGFLQILLIIIGAVVVAPVSEEILFRGFLYGVTKRFTDRWFSAIFTSLVFACTHLNIASTLPLFVLAMGFAIAYEVTGSLIVPITMHALFNATSLLLLSFAPRP